jgi:hypothetical protein
MWLNPITKLEYPSPQFPTHFLQIHLALITLSKLLLSLSTTPLSFGLHGGKQSSLISYSLQANAKSA